VDAETGATSGASRLPWRTRLLLAVLARLVGRSAADLVGAGRLLTSAVTAGRAVLAPGLAEVTSHRADRRRGLG
jgi:hypothetical protein